MSQRVGDWIQTYSGRQFWPLDPRADEIHLIDIAAGLANDCRFGGHCRAFYSVAEHSVWMTRYLKSFWRVSPHILLAALLHDASEGLGLRDIPRPIKQSIPGYKAIEAGVMRVVADKYGFDWPLDPIVKRADERIGVTERDQIMAPPPAPWDDGVHASFDLVTPLPITLACWAPDRAMREFLDEAASLGLKP